MGIRTDLTYKHAYSGLNYPASSRKPLTLYKDGIKVMVNAQMWMLGYFRELEPNCRWEIK